MRQEICTSLWLIVEVLADLWHCRILITSARLPNDFKACRELLMIMFKENVRAMRLWVSDLLSLAVEMSTWRRRHTRDFRIAFEPSVAANVKEKSSLWLDLPVFLSLAVKILADK